MYKDTKKASINFCVLFPYLYNYYNVLPCKTEKRIMNVALKSIAKNIFNLRSVKKNEKYFCEVDRTYAQIEN